nr:pentatricopeptide repeat-containing protein At2g15690 [Tanacetum cinerariifolium]
MIISAIQAVISRFTNNNECTVFLTSLKAVGNRLRDDGLEMYEQMRNNGLFLNEEAFLAVLDCAEIWEAVMNYARIHGDIDLEDISEEILINLDPLKVDPKKIPTNHFLTLLSVCLRAYGVFFSSLHGRPIRGNNVETLIKSGAFKTLDDNDAVSLCCVGILHLVLLGLEDRRPVSNWILRRWPALYATQHIDEVDKKIYLITGFAWAFKAWILESFRATTNDYYTRYHRLPRIGQLPVERLVTDEIEARSRWWVSSRAYFDERNIEDERIPRHLNRNNYFVVPSKMYQEFDKQRRGYKQMMEKSDDMYDKMSQFMKDMRGGPVPLAKEPIIADQHYGIRDLSGFQSYQV